MNSSPIFQDGGMPAVINHDVTINGDLTITGNLYFGDAGVDILEVAGYIIGSVAGNTYISIGTPATSHTLNAINDLFVAGELEVDGDTFLDAGVTVATYLYRTGGFFLNNGNSENLFALHTLQPLVLTDYANRTLDHGHGAQSDPALFIHSRTASTTDNTEWIGITVDPVAGGVISMGPSSTEDQDGHDLTISAGIAGSGGTGNHNGGIISLFGGALEGTGKDGYVRIGSSGTASHTLDDDSLYVKGVVEIDGVTYHDTHVYLSVGSILGFENTVVNYGGLMAVADDGLHFITGRDTYGNNNIIITSQANYTADHNHDTLSADPTVFFHSETAPTTDDTEWLSVSFIAGTGASILAGDGGTEDQDGHDIIIAAGDAGSGGTGNHNGGSVHLYGGAKTGTGENRPVMIGDPTIAHSAVQTTNSLSIEGACEVQGQLWAGGNLYFDATVGAGIGFGGGSEFGSLLISADDGLVLQTGQSDGNGNNHFIVGAQPGSIDYDHDTISTNPTVFIHSVISPVVSNNQWGSFSHNQENFVIATGLNVGTGTGATTDNNGLLVSLSPITSAQPAGFGVNFTRTLNAGAGTGGTDTFDLITGDLTLTDITGFDGAVNVLNLKVDSVTVFAIDAEGGATLTGNLSVSGANFRGRVAVGAGDYNPSIKTDDYIIAVDNTAAPRAVTISSEDIAMGSTTIPRIFVIKDESGNAAVNNITITLESGGTIDGAANYVINGNYNSVTLYIDGTNAWIY